MVLKILLVVSIILQLSAAGIAIKLTRVTKYNLSWILITIALTVMALQRLVEFIQTIGGNVLISEEAFVWAGVITSLCFAAGVFLIRKILSYISMMEEKRRSYENRILNAIIKTEEKERQRFSKEIHDGLGPLLSSAKMSVSALENMNTDTKQQEIITNLNIVLDESVKTIKEVANNLNPHVLMNFGLASGVNSFIKKLALFNDIKIDFTTNLKDRRFGFDVEVILYRVICEMINNTIKHAEATHITLDINYRGGEIFIIFEDNGKGFDPKTVLVEGGKGMGLSNIFSRISSIEGDVDIDSSPGNGVLIKIRSKTR